MPFSGAGFELDKPRGRGTELNRPSKNKVILALIAADEDDEFYFWGHGVSGGGISVNTEENLTAEDLRFIARARKRQGKGRIRLANIHACGSTTASDTVNAWLEVSEEMRGYCGLTAQVWPPKINPQETHKVPIAKRRGQGFDKWKSKK